MVPTVVRAEVEACQYSVMCGTFKARSLRRLGQKYSTLLPQPACSREVAHVEGLEGPSGRCPPTQTLLAPGMEEALAIDELQSKKVRWNDYYRKYEQLFS